MRPRAQAVSEGSLLLSGEEAPAACAAPVSEADRDRLRAVHARMTAKDAGTVSTRLRPVRKVFDAVLLPGVTGLCLGLLDDHLGGGGDGEPGALEELKARLADAEAFAANLTAARGEAESAAAEAVASSEASLAELHSALQEARLRAAEAHANAKARARAARRPRARPRAPAHALRWRACRRPA